MTCNATTFLSAKSDSQLQELIKETQGNQRIQLSYYF